MKNILIAAALMTVGLAQSTVSLEMSAGSKEQQTTSRVETRLEARDTILTSAINKINTEQLAILSCMKQNKFYKPSDSTADAKGCVDIHVSTQTVNKTVDLADVKFDTYPGASKNSKGWIGTHSEVIDLKPYVDEGAKSIAVTGVLAGFTGGCSNVSGAISMNVANVATSVPTAQFQCHYDNSPNRSSYFLWSYSGSTKKMTVTAKMTQTKAKMTSAKIDAVKVKYAITKTILKVGDGK